MGPVPFTIPPNHEPKNVLPDFEYPVPFTIRNTFINAKIGRPLSLEEFYDERRVHSCPIAPPPGLEDVIEDVENAQSWQSTRTDGAMMGSVVTAVASPGTSATTNWLSGPVPGGQQINTPPGSFYSRSHAPVLRLAHALAEPEIVTPVFPSIGSQGHFFGTCKPCAFFHTKGCGNGTECSFCHLCPEGEKQRRKKEKIAVNRDIRRLRGC